jgi:REP element-mobilizing transposase RayT
MARKLRVEYLGDIYRVMNRGDRREPIFQDDTDRTRFLETLGEACAKTEWRVHACCLMANHFHLVVETPGGNGHLDPCGQPSLDGGSTTNQSTELTLCQK